jgi:hypothetical protein
MAQTGPKINVYELGDIPRVAHFAIVTTETIYIPGDQRSRDYPGHGYPESNETVVKYKAFLKKSDWESEIQAMETVTYGKKNYVALEVYPATIDVKVNVNVRVKTLDTSPINDYKENHG